MKELKESTEAFKSGRGILNLLHIADPTLPIGGFSHSNGMETYVQQGRIHNTSSTAAFIQSMLENNYKYNDCLMMRFAHEYASTLQMEKLVELDNECTALKSSKEIREASLKMGLRLLKIYENLIEDDFLKKYCQDVRKEKKIGNFPIAYGVITALLNSDIRSSIHSFYYNAAVSMVTNAVKLVPLGQIEGQKILFRLHSIILTLTEEVLKMDKKLLGVCNPALDIKSMQHERLYSRLYMS